MPDRFFKALAVDVGGQWHTVAFIVENNRQSRSPRQYATTVDSVEALIGRDLFPQLPDAAEGDYNWNIFNR